MYTYIIMLLYYARARARTRMRVYTRVRSRVRERFKKVLTTCRVCGNVSSVMSTTMDYRELVASLPEEITAKQCLLLMEKIAPKARKPCSSCARTFINRKRIKPVGTTIGTSGKAALLYSKQQVCDELEAMTGAPCTEVDTKDWMPKEEFVERSLNGEFAGCPGEWIRAILWLDRRNIRLRYNKWHARRQRTNFVNRDDLKKFTLTKTH